MFEKIIDPYRGLSKEVWFMALTMLVNRAGAMVIPFLSLYLTSHLGFSLNQVGWILSFYGFGSVAGVFMGGKLSDRLGYYKVMYLSLIATGIVFFIIQYASLRDTILSMITGRPTRLKHIGTTQIIAFDIRIPELWVKVA